MNTEYSKKEIRNSCRELELKIRDLIKEYDKKFENKYSFIIVGEERSWCGCYRVKSVRHLPLGYFEKNFIPRISVFSTSSNKTSIIRSGSDKFIKSNNYF